MSTHSVNVVSLLISEHPSADRLEIAHVGGYQALVKKGEFQTGDLAAYIPEDSVVPDPLLEQMGLQGKLAGSAGNRVKAIKLRGVLSQGLVLAARPGWQEGQDVTKELGIVKYMPPVPVSMSGAVVAVGSQKTMRYDIENIKRYPEVLVQGEEVRITEKIHGTACFIGVLSEQDADEELGRLMVSSKGLGAKGFVFELHQEKPNVYVRAARQYKVMEKLGDWAKDQTVFLCGEVFGSGVQDLKYGADSRVEGELGFRIFDVHLGSKSDVNGRFLDHEELEAFLKQFGFASVPVLYVGPYSKEVLAEYTTGMETVSGESLHLREGVVVRPTVERRDVTLGRVQLKSVSEKYLTRKGGTEYQ